MSANFSILTLVYLVYKLVHYLLLPYLFVIPFAYHYNVLPQAKDSDIPPSATSGRKRSVFLLMLSIGIAFFFQYGVAPAFQPDGNKMVTQHYLYHLLVDAWSSGCGYFNDAALQLQYARNSNTYRAASSGLLFFILAASAAFLKLTANRKGWVAKFILFLIFNGGFFPSHVRRTIDLYHLLVDAWSSGCGDFNDAALQLQCAGNSGTYRAASSGLLFFILAASAAFFKPTANREGWVAKFILFLIFNVAAMFIPNEPLFSLIMINVFRVGAVFFIIFQQIIFVDVAFNLNESLVAKADKADMDGGEGKGKKWLYALLALAALLFVGSIVVLGILYKYFGGCGINIAFITVTLSVGLISTAVQLCCEEANLLTSASIFGYATYLCYVSVSQNPDGDCNPTLTENSVTGIIIGVGLTLLSLLWTGWSYTAAKCVGERSDAVHGEEDPDQNRNKTVSGIVVGAKNYGAVSGAVSDTEESTTDTFSSSWKLNIILCLTTCWYAVALTGWGSVEIGGNSANPSVGRVSMWMITGSQWLMQTLYLWILTAPKLFPHRDFS